MCFYFTGASFVSKPDNSTVCAGTNVTLSWRFDNEAFFHYAYWKKDGVTIMWKNVTSAAVRLSEITNIYYVSNGEIQIRSVSMLNEGEYRLSVYYTFASDLASLDDVVSIKVLGKLIVKSVT